MQTARFQSNFVLVEDYTSGTHNEFDTDPLMQSVIFDHGSEESEVFVSVEGEPALPLNVATIPRYEERIYRVLNTAIQTSSVAAAHEYNRPLLESLPASAPLRLLFEALRAQPQLCSVVSEALGSFCAKSTAGYLASLAYSPLLTYMDLVQRAQIGTEAESLLRGIGENYLDGRLSLVEAKQQFWTRIMGAPADRRQYLVGAELALFGSSAEERRAQMLRWIDTVEGSLRALEGTTLNIFDGMSCYQRGIPTALTAEPESIALVARDESPGAKLLEASERLRSLWLRCLPDPLLREALQQHVRTADAGLASALIHKVSIAYADIIREESRRLLSRIGMRLLEIDPPTVVLRIATTAKAVFADLFVARGDLLTRVPRLHLLSRLAELPRAKHAAIPVSLAAKDTAEAEGRYFKQTLFPALERLCSDGDLLTDLICVLARGTPADSDESGWLKTIAGSASHLYKEQIVNALAKSFSERLNSVTSDIAINKSIVQMVTEGLSSETLQETQTLFLSDLEDLPSDETSESYYQRALVALRYLPIILTGSGEGVQTQLLSATLIQAHHLMQFRPFAKNLIFHLLDVLVDEINQATLPSRSHALQRSDLHLNANEQNPAGPDDARALAACTDLLAYLFKHGFKEMSKETGWFSVSGWLYTAGRVGMEYDTVKGYLQGNVQAIFGAAWPLRGPSILKSAYGWISSTVDASAERIAKYVEDLIRK